MTTMNNDSLDNTPQQGLTPKHPQNIDEARIDEVLVEDTLDDTHYPSIQDIASDEAVEDSHQDD